MIAYSYDNPALAGQKDLLMTDGTVTVSGTNYTVTGATVTIDNSILEFESFSLKQSLNSGSQLQFGSCEAGEISFVIHENIPTIKGKTLKVYLIPDNDASKMLQLGVYKVYEDKLSADRTRRSIVAYDALYDIINADVATWYNSELPNSSTTKTLAQFRADFLNHFGITAESATLVNDGITVKRTIEPETLSGADVIKAICEINGVFGTITNQGKFRFLELTNAYDEGLYPSDTLYPADDLYPKPEGSSDIPRSKYIDVQFEDYTANGITQLVVRTNSDDVGVTVGTSGNTYVITGNFLVYGFTSANLTTAANNILNVIKNRPYTPATVEALGNPLHEVGDAISIHSQYRTIKTYILERSMTGIQALRDTYSANGEEKYTEPLNSVASQFKELSGKVASLKVESDGIESRVEDIEDGSASVIQQLTTDISLKVSKNNIVGDLNAKMSGITITPDSIQVSSTGTFTVDSSNFVLDSDSNLTMATDVSETKGVFTLSSSDGVFKTQIKSGNIELTAGNNRIKLDIRNNGAIYFGNTTSDSYLTAYDGYIGGSQIITASGLASRKVLTAYSDIGGTTQADGPTFQKYLKAHGTTDYTLTLQTITIGAKQYVVYAYERP